MEEYLNQYGYITSYLVSGMKEEPFESGIQDDDQMRCEKKMRLSMAVQDDNMPTGEIRIGGNSALGLPWNYMYSYGNWFVDLSKFYPKLAEVQLHAATVLVAEEEMETEVWLWSYAAVRVWVEGKLAGEITTPCYKPIQRQVLRWHLKKGRNLVYVKLKNLGVRDTRTLFGIQIPGEERHKIMVSLPDEKRAASYQKTGQWLSGIRLRKGTFLFPGLPPENSRIVYDKRPRDFKDFPFRYETQEIPEGLSVELAEGKPYVQVQVAVGEQLLTRNFERYELLSPVYSDDKEEHHCWEKVFRDIASVGQIPRGTKESFSMYPILARYFFGIETKEDEDELFKSLNQIESRRDCSDFLTCAIVRFLKLYPMKETLAQRCREVMLGYRYWMNEDGNDGMCFWSENHSLIFFVSAYLAGDIYPDGYFVRAKKLGKEMKAQARQRIYDWMESTLTEGFEEFHSGGYTPITFAAILNVIDFGDEELSVLAWKVADRLLEELALQTFQGVSVAPMGRVYREVLYPFAQDIQSLIHLADPAAPEKFSEWVIFLATSRYRMPDGLKERMKEDRSLVYDEGNARICVEKTKDYILTSVQSPRTDGRSRVWENRYETPGTDKGSFAYAKSLNECFHGTTQMEPGVFGYQQHLWQAAVSPCAVVFVNHPGGSSEACSTRPGYWFGNGIMPALKQEKQMLLAVYQIPDTHPIPFTHIYWPGERFEEQIHQENWMVGRVGRGAVALWCSEKPVPYDDMLALCEYRVESRRAAYLCVCGSLKEGESLNDFLRNCQTLKPVYEKTEGRLKAGNHSLSYVEHENTTQYV